MSIRYSEPAAAANATGAESGVPAADAGLPCGDGQAEGFWYIGMTVPLTGTATVQPWLWNEGRKQWHRVGSSIGLVGNQVVQIYTNGRGGRTFLEVTAASAFPVTRDLQLVEKGA